MAIVISFEIEEHNIVVSPPVPPGLGLILANGMGGCKGEGCYYYAWILIYLFTATGMFILSFLFLVEPCIPEEEQYPIPRLGLA